MTKLNSEMGLSPRHLAVFVADVEASVAFYRRAFGFHEVYRFDALHSSHGHCWQVSGRWLELGQSGFYLEIFPLSWRPEFGRSCISQNYLALRVDDVKSAYAVAMAADGNEIDLPDSVGKIWRGEPIQMELAGRPPLLARIGFVAGPNREIIELVEITGTTREEPWTRKPRPPR